jgi:hypothetical protein
MNEDSEYDAALKVRDGLFLSASRTCGEQYVEPFIREKFGLKEPVGNDHDAISVDGIRYEIKTSKVLRKHENTKNDRTLLDRIFFENYNAETNRLVPFSEAQSAKYDANIQNVKRDHFQELLYILLFEDVIKVFKISTDKVSSIPRWSDKHGRYDQLGKSGQFMMNSGSIKWHLENQLVATYTYLDVLQTLKNL